MRIAIAAFILLVGGAALLFGGSLQRPRAILQTPTSMPANAQQATFAGGCFWGVEERFRHVPGVLSTMVGYSGGTLANPSYEDVCTDKTGHAESVLVTFDPAKVSYAELLDAFWSSIDPTELNFQGPDTGTQYRSIIFYHDAEQERVARASVKELQAAHTFHGPIVTEIIPAAKFYPAEDYHQQYFAKNGGTCHVGPVEVHTNLAKEAAKARG